MNNFSKTFGLSESLYLPAAKNAHYLTGKKSGKLTIPLLLLLAICLCHLPAQAKYGGGSGTAEDPYLIYDANQMNNIGDNPGDWGKHFKLMADIDLGAFTGTAFNIIANFKGVFDGNGFTISNFTYASTSEGNIALFAFVSTGNAEIKNLGLIAPIVDAGSRDYAGSLVSQLSAGTITNCYVLGGSVSGASSVGGLVGDNDGTIRNSYAITDVSGTLYVGGLVGSNGGTISNCYVEAGSASGGNVVGGLVGVNDGWFRDGTINNCYSTGTASGGQYVGGLLGYNSQGVVRNSFWDIEASGLATSAGGTGKTTAEMKTVSTFSAWACENVWTIDEGVDYPRLYWQNAPGETIIGALLGGGTGTLNDPYLIYTAEHLNTVGLLSCEWGKHFKLMADIDLSGYTGNTFNILGTEPGNPFTGVFDGNGHTISNFSYTSTEGDNIGLFGYVDGSGAHIKELGLIAPEVDGGTGDNIGSLVGYMRDGIITNCYAEDGSVSGHYGGDVHYTFVPTTANLRDISTTGTRVILGYNEMSYGIPMPFSFNFYGTSYYQVFISSSGFITFEAGQDPGWGSQQPLPDPYTPNGLIAGFWTYLYPPEGGQIRYRTLGSPGSRQFVIGFYDMPHCCEAGYFPVTFEIILHEGTNNIELQYGTAISPGYYTTVGVENFNGTEGLQLAYTYDVAYENEGFLITAIAGSRNVGGLVGRNEATITDSYARTNVSGVDTAGGIVGFNSQRIINNCYSTGSVSGDYRLGGLVGQNDQGAITNSFWDIDTSGQTTSAGGTGKTTAEMYNTNTYMDAGWDFVDKPDGPSDIWAEPPGAPAPPPPVGPGYPILWWQLSPVPELPTFSGGTGEPNDPYLISTADQLSSIGHNPRLMGAHFKLINDIDLTGVNFYIIGSQFYPYTGVFDGNGYVISNLTYTSWSENTVGLFAYVKGVIKNLGLVNPDIGAWAGDYAGSLVGWLSSGTITNCYVDSGIVEGNYSVGGLVGYNDTGSISDCYSTAAVSGTFAGGIAGWNYGTLTDSFAEGDIDGYYYVGGLTGFNYGTVTDCYAAGDVSGYYYLGGLVGLNYGTVSYSYAEGDVGIVRGYSYVGGLVGWNELGTITYSYATGNVSGEEAVGGLVGNNGYYYYYEPDMGMVSNCYSTGSVEGFYDVGGLVGNNQSVASVFLNHTVTPIQNRLRNIRLTGTPVTLGDDQVSGAIPIGFNFNFYATDFSQVYVSSNGFITFLPNQYSGCCSGQQLPDSYNPNGVIAGFWTDLYPPGAGGAVRYQTLGSEGSRQFVIGFYQVSHCCGDNYYPVTFEIILHEGTNNIELQYGSTATTDWHINTAGIENFTGTDALLVAYGNVSLSYDAYLITIDGEPEIVGGVTNSYSTGSVVGFQNVGGLAGENEGTVYASFWDIETSGQPGSNGGTGLPTAQMQMAATFTDAEWDFTTPVWAIEEGVDYPHLWWELAPLLHEEPDITLWTSNTISWDPLTGAGEYYAECAADANFTTIVYNTGWITETSCMFAGLESGKRYWYCVKARNSAAVESGWSNVETSQQFTLDDAVEMLLDERSLKNRNMKNALLNKINAVFHMLDEGLYADALDKLQNDILAKTNGCALIGGPDRNDWIKTCEAQALIYPLVMETIEYVRGLMEQSLNSDSPEPEWLRTSTGSTGDPRRSSIRR